MVNVNNTVKGNAVDSFAGVMRNVGHFNLKNLQREGQPGKGEGCGKKGERQEERGRGRERRGRGRERRGRGRERRGRGWGNN